jgi:hypothetical protein
MRGCADPARCAILARMDEKPRTPSEEDKREVERMIAEGNWRARRRALGYWGSILVGVATFGVAMYLLSYAPFLFQFRITGQASLIVAIVAGALAGGFFYRLMRARDDSTAWGDDT